MVMVNLTNHDCVVALWQAQGDTRFYYFRSAVINTLLAGSATNSKRDEQ